MAQRMESVAPPGGVMLSESTARLVDEPSCSASRVVHIKGSDALVPAGGCCVGEHRSRRRSESSLVGRIGR